MHEFQKVFTNPPRESLSNCLQFVIRYVSVLSSPFDCKPSLFALIRLIARLKDIASYSSLKK